MTSARRRLKILQVVDGFRMGGAENKLWELVARLDTSKYEVMLANVGPSGPLATEFRQLGVEIFDFPRRHGFDLAPMLQLYRLMRQRRIDIVQTTLFWADFIGMAAAKCARVPMAISWETVTHEGDPYHNNFQRRAGYSLVANCADLIVAVSHEVRDSLINRRSIAPSKIRVIHYGVNTEHYRPSRNGVWRSKRQEIGAAPEDFLIGIVARLERWKGHRYFIEAFAEIAPQFPQARVILMGEGSLRASLEDMTHRNNLQDRIHFLGVRKDVVELLNCIDLLVLPSLPGEGLPNVLLEAMACRKPVIATAVGGVPELVRDGHNGFLVPPANVAALRDALLQALREPERLQQLARNARQTVEGDFSVEQQVTSFEAMYDACFERVS